MGVVYHSPDGTFLAHTAARDPAFEQQLQQKGQPFHLFEEAPHPKDDPFPTGAFLRRTYYESGSGTVVAHHVHYLDGRVQPVGTQPQSGAKPAAAQKPWATGDQP